MWNSPATTTARRSRPRPSPPNPELPTKSGAAESAPTWVRGARAPPHSTGAAARAAEAAPPPPITPATPCRRGVAPTPDGTRPMPPDAHPAALALLRAAHPARTTPDRPRIVRARSFFSFAHENHSLPNSYLKRFPQGNQSSANPRLHRAQRLSSLVPDLAVPQAFPVSHFEGVALGGRHASHHAAHFLRGPRALGLAGHVGRH